MTKLATCPGCHVAHVNVRCPKAPKLCVNGRKAHADGDHHYVSPPSQVICRECMDAISAKLAAAQAWAEAEMGPTPGPWTYQEHRRAQDDAERTLVTIRDARNVCLATLDRLDYAVSVAETRANARLIALAPRMADLVRRIVEHERKIGDKMNRHVAGVRTEARAILRELAGRNP